MIPLQTRQVASVMRSPLLTLLSLLLLCSGLGAQTITVLVVYTPAVERALGVNGARALAINSIESVNQVMRNSGLPYISYRLVGNSARKVDYVESDKSMEVDLDHLRNPTDGFMDEVHTLRARFGADLVHLLRLGPAGGAGGMAYFSVQWRESGPSGDPALGFAVTAHNGAVSNFTFAHEIGHNMGLYHAREDQDYDIDDPTNRDYWFGYRFRSLANPNQVFNTVMAYDSKISGLSQSPIPHFSNPLARYTVTGDRQYFTGLRSTGAAISSYVMPPETSGILPQGPSDQARALRENAPVVAAYFGNSPTPPPPPPVPPPSAPSLSIAGSWQFPPVRVGLTAVLRVTIQNRSSFPVTVDPLAMPDPVFSTQWKGGTIPARGSISVPVTFRPAAVTDYPGSVAIKVGGVPVANVVCRGSGRR